MLPWVLVASALDQIVFLKDLKREDDKHKRGNNSLVDA